MRTTLQLTVTITIAACQFMLSSCATKREVPFRVPFARAWLFEEIRREL